MWCKQMQRKKNNNFTWFGVMSMSTGKRLEDNFTNNENLQN